MTARFRAYEPESDFLRVRDFLIATWHPATAPRNWRRERWNYARYFVAPLLGAYSVENPTDEDSLRAIRQWEECVGIWETDSGEIAAVVNADECWPGRGTAYIQQHPDWRALGPELVEYAEATFRNVKTGRLTIHIDHEDTLLEEAATARGFEKDEKRREWNSALPVESITRPALPEGFHIRSMADCDDVEARREVFGRSFNHAVPCEWPSAFAYRELQRAPDYRPELDLSVVAPDGRLVSCCIVWFDEVNRFGVLEPVGTHPEFRRRGLGREVVMEAARRVAAMGATAVWVGTDLAFYLAIGFVPHYGTYGWRKG